ncbi:glycosyltransferase family 2 protein [Longitalea luteola]|uniref:glycosyltransferase family 2 protein n=1 Tax=Longitalea luteola TaxID=2812563 RepID=UPI001A968B89|nr:glycosyltransferase family 2 protein [Longitalea luteola]
MLSNCELSVVIPAYNEAQNIVDLIKDWHQAFVVNEVAYRFIIIDDGSVDNTVDLLKALQVELPTITIYPQNNKGHGPAILKGYEIGMQSPWIFQIDADHQFETNAFKGLWQQRHNYDLLLAEREVKHATLFRKIISNASGLIVHLLFGNGVKDVNSPYRLMRADKLQQALQRIPPNSFAPNVLITSFFIFTKKRIFTNVVHFRKNVSLKKSRMNTYFFKGCINSMLQVIKFRFTL